MTGDETTITLVDKIAKTAKKLADMDFEVSYRTRKMGLFGYPRKGFKDPRLGLFKEARDDWFPSKYIRLIREQENNVARLQASQD